MKKKILIALAIILVIVGIAAIALSMMPRDYTVSHSISIDATPEQIHRHVGDLDKWPAWTPWSKQDPTMVITEGQPRTGVGANQSWVGEEGNGRLEFTKADPRTGVEMDLWFEDDSMQCKSAYTYTPSADGSSTTVTWTMSGTVPVPVFGGLIASKMDDFVGPMFDQGLADLKTVVEADIAEPEPDTDGYPDEAIIIDEDVIIDNTVTPPIEEDLEPHDLPDPLGDPGIE
jgi:hypothetical protein